MISGYVKSDGSSTALPQGVVDMSAMAGKLSVPPELEESLARMAATLDSKETTARFKLEVIFARDSLRNNVDVKGIVSVWTNGGFLNGGGDASVYLCPNERGEPPNRFICLSPLNPNLATPRESVCSECGKVTASKRLIGQIIYNVPRETWARALAHLFQKLDYSADIRCLMPRESLRVATEREREHFKGGEHLARIRGKEEWITYPLACILKDTATGASLERRLLAFLKA